jgi:hypothetical protein
MGGGGRTDKGSVHIVVEKRKVIISKKERELERVGKLLLEN